ncbi:MAG: hypothetical protein NTX35_20685, partial [Verrucomicrobia bacterium]|nr:hypothetical protein [Verrucomicrobiota bacterium]
ERGNPINRFNASFSGNAFLDGIKGTAYGLLNRSVVIALEGRGKIDLQGIAADSFGNALGNSIVGAIRQGQEDRKVDDVLKQAGVDPDDPNVSPTLLKTTRGLVQQGYNAKDIATYIGNEGIQARVFGGADLANQAIAGFSDKDVGYILKNGPAPEPVQPEQKPGMGLEILVVGRDATSTFVEDVLHPVIDAAAAFGDFAKQYEGLAQLAAAGTQIALSGPAAFVKNTIVDTVVGQTVGEYSQQVGSYIQEKAAGFIQNTWGFGKDESSFLANGVMFAGQVVLDSARNLVDSAKNISNIVGGRRGNAATRAHVDLERDRLMQENPDWRHRFGGTDSVTGEPLPELYVPAAGGGRSGSTYPDLSFQKPDGSFHHHNTVDTYADGQTLTTREADNLRRLQLLRPNDTTTTAPKP